MSSRANPVIETAVGPLASSALEQLFPPEMRLVDDRLAYRFLPGSIRAMISLARFPPLRDLLFRLMEGAAPGSNGWFPRRKRYIEEKLAEGLGAGIEEVVNLGAGMDTLAYRLPSGRAVPFYEVDLPENIALKEARLRQVLGGVPAHVTLVPVDLQRHELGEALAARGFDVGRRTFFIWEAVTQYLTEDAVRRTMDYLARARPGSRMVFTYVRKDFIDGSNLYGLRPGSRVVRISEQLWRFGLAPELVGGFLAEYSWREVEQIGSLEAAARYPTPRGRTLPVWEVERAVYAEKGTP